MIKDAESQWTIGRKSNSSELKLQSPVNNSDTPNLSESSNTNKDAVFNGNLIVSDFEKLSKSCENISSPTSENNSVTTNTSSDNAVQNNKNKPSERFKIVTIRNASQNNNQHQQMISSNLNSISSSSTSSLQSIDIYQSQQIVVIIVLIQPQLPLNQLLTIIQIV